MWLGIDRHGQVGWFCSETCRTPAGLPDTLEEFEELYEFTDYLPFRGAGFTANPHLDSFVDLRGKRAMLNYLSNFEELAQMGLYVFDKTEPIEFENPMYHQVLAPENPLNVSELSPEEAAILSRVRLDVDFSECYSLDISETF